MRELYGMGLGMYQHKVHLDELFHFYYYYFLPWEYENPLYRNYGHVNGLTCIPSHFKKMFLKLCVCV